MASIVVTDTAGFDMRDFEFKDLYHGMDYQSSPTFYQVTYRNNSADQFTGEDFSFSGKGVPTGGTVTGYAHFTAGSLVVSVYDFHIGVTKIAHAAKTASTQDDYAVVKSILSGRDSFTGGQDSDHFMGYNGGDTLDGKAGSDVLTGGAGADTFVFGTDYGHDKISDFGHGKDRIDLSNWQGIDSFSDVKSHLKVSGGDLLIRDHNDWLTLEHTHKGDIHASDFIF
jgi:Ca2+-binding RTX toxin-like protein